MSNLSANPLVSIVMPAYNAADFIGVAIESLMLQDYAHIEIIVLDDGSTDDTHLIASAYAEQDTRIQVKSLAHAGAGAARNYGMAQAAGDYLLFADADDVFEPQYVSTLVHLALSTGADIAVCSADCFTLDPAHATRPWEAKRWELAAGTYTSYELALRLYQCMSLVVWNKLWRKSFVDKAQLRFQNLPRYNDAFFSILGLAQAATIAKTRDVLVHYRVGSGTSLVDKGHLHPLCDVQALDAARESLQEKGRLDGPLQQSFDSLCISTVTWRLAQFARVSPGATKELYAAYFDTYAQKWGLTHASYPYVRSPRYALEHQLMRHSGVQGLLWASQGDHRGRSSGTDALAEVRFIARLFRSISKRK